MKEELEKKPKLWTKNYTIMTLGSVVSLMGNYVISFLLSVIILEYSNSVFLYGLFWTLYYLVKVMTPVLCGPMIDRFSKQKIIYILDFFSAGVFFLVWFILFKTEISIPIIYGIGIYLGFSDSCYSVAFSSIYPSLVKKEQLQKAYSIYSMLDTSAGIAVPIAALLYKFLGAKLVFLFASVLYLIAAIFETFPQITELSEMEPEHVKSTSIRQAFQTYKEGFEYLKGNKTILFFAILIMIQFFARFNANTLLLPFCSEKWDNSYLWYILIAGAFASGYFLGGWLNYKFKIPSQYRYKSLFVFFFAIAILGGTCYFFPIWGMIIIEYWWGVLSSIAYSMRMSTIQGVIKEEYRGRYNGVENSLINIGIVSGTFLSGCFAEMYPIPFVALGGYFIFVIALVIQIAINGTNLKNLFNDEKIISKE